MSQIIENYSHGITREWRYDRRLVIVQTQGDTSDEAVDVWSELVIKTLEEIPEAGAFFFIDDLSHPHQTITPYAMKKSREVMNNVPRLREQTYFAVVLPDSFVARIGAILMKQFLSWGSKVKYKVFTSRVDADKWIYENAEKEGIIPHDSSASL